MTQENTTRINIRGIAPDTVAALNRAAGARGWTQARYVERLVQLHEMLRTQLSDTGATVEGIRAILRDLELETVAT